MPLVYGGPYDSDPTNPTDSYIVASYPANERTSRTQAHAWMDEEHDHTNGRHKFTRMTVSERASYSPVNDGTMVVHSDMIAFYDSAGSKWLEYGILRTGDLKVKTTPTVPDGFLLANGGAYSRSTYAELFEASSLVRTGATTSGSAIVTGLSATSDLFAGMPVEGVGVPPGTTVLTVDSASQVTLSANATATGGPSLRFFLFGNGDGSTTFNVIDMGGVVPVGYKVSGDGDGDYKAIGQSYGEKRHALSSSEAPAIASGGTHAHTVPFTGDAPVVTAVGGNAAATQNHTHAISGDGAHTHTYTGTGAAHENRQPSRVVAWMVKT